MASLTDRLAHAWNAFTDRNDALLNNRVPPGASYGTNPSRARLFVANERSILAAVNLRIAIDVASMALRHIRVDDQGNYMENMKSGLNRCLNVEANLDQGGFAMRLDLALSMLEWGDAALAPVECDISPEENGGYEIRTLRVGRIVQYYPRDVMINVYNQDNGRQEQLTVSKEVVALPESPLASVMNEPNSTLQRLIRKLQLLDITDERVNSKKLDLIIQLPYQVKSEIRRDQARQRREEIEFQLTGSQFGIAYADATEKITQLNRPVENNLMSEVEYLGKRLYAELGITEDVMNGTADEAAMLNYHLRTVNPIAQVIIEECTRKFLTKTAQTQGQKVDYFFDPFKYVPLSQMAEIADKFNRNEIVSGNEFRKILGMLPSKDPKADELRNSNMPRKYTDLPSEPDSSALPNPQLGS